jgi:hypothetical protein
MKFPKEKKVKVWKMPHFLTKLVRQKEKNFYCKKPRHFVRNCLKKKNDEKEKANQAYDDQEQMFVVALNANDHMVSSILVQHNT